MNYRNTNETHVLYTMAGRDKEGANLQTYYMFDRQTTGGVSADLLRPS